MAQNRIVNYLNPPRLEHDPTAPAQESWSDTGRQQFEQWQRMVERFIAAHPQVALGAALSLGVLLGWLTKRR